MNIPDIQRRLARIIEVVDDLDGGIGVQDSPKSTTVLWGELKALSDRVTELEADVKYLNRELDNCLDEKAEIIEYRSDEGW